MPDVGAINRFIQGELSRKGGGCVSAVEAATWLDDGGLLRDSVSRPGKPLRDLLRAHRIIGQRQEPNSRWFICRERSTVEDRPPPNEQPLRHPPPAVRYASSLDPHALTEALMTPLGRTRASAWPPQSDDLDSAGLYSWWADQPGADHLSAGLELPLRAGLIYAGQAGAGRSRATLRSRIGGNHLHGNVYGSTMRLTLASTLLAPLDLQPTGDRHMESESERRLSDWIRQHLSVAVVPVPDRAGLRDLEGAVLNLLDPPLNLQGRPQSEVRTRLSYLRSVFIGRSR